MRVLAVAILLLLIATIAIAAAVYAQTESTPEPTPTTDGFVAVSTGSDHVCGIRGDGKAECWSLDDSNLYDSPAIDDVFVDLDSFGSHTCGLNDIAEIICWTAPETVAELPTQPATPIPSGEVGSRENPVPYGATIEVHNSDTDHWEITVIGVDPYADPEIERENSYNDTADEGNQFFLVRVKAKYLGTGSERFYDYRLKALGSSGTTYGSSCGVIPFDLPYHELFTGGEIEGSKCWEVASSDVDSLTMFLEPDSLYRGGERVWFSLDYGSWHNSYAGERHGLAWHAAGSASYHAGRQTSLPDLFVFCFDSALSGRYYSVTAFWHDQLADPNNRLPVRLTWDDEAPVYESWELGINGDAVFLPYHKQFISDMLTHSHLKFEVQGDSGWQSASFDLNGFESAYSPVRTYCGAGLSLASSSIEDVQLNVAEAHQSAGFDR